MRYRHLQPAFTLAELLIALAILGVIATFTIPKILSGSDDGRKKAVFKETISTIAGIMNNGRISGGISTPSNCRYYFFDHINAPKMCPNNASTQGCHDAGGAATDPAVELHNGASIGDLDGCLVDGNNAWVFGINIDWNGSKPPNTPDDDQLVMSFNVSDTETSVSGIPPKRFGPHPTTQTLYDWIFSQ